GLAFSPPTVRGARKPGGGRGGDGGGKKRAPLAPLAPLAPEAVERARLLARAGDPRVASCATWAAGRGSGREGKADSSGHQITPLRQNRTQARPSAATLDVPDRRTAPRDGGHTTVRADLVAQPARVRARAVGGGPDGDVFGRRLEVFVRFDHGRVAVDPLHLGRG